MGDRCYARITVRRCDLAKWEDLGYGFEYGDDEESYASEASVDLIDEERNYGVSDKTSDLAPGCPMFGWHEEGGDYPAFLFAYDGTTFMDHERGGNGVPVIDCGPDGPSTEDVENAKRFHAFYSSVEKMVCGEKSTADQPLQAAQQE